MPSKRELTPREIGLRRAILTLRECFPAFVIIVPNEDENDKSPPCIVHGGHYYHWRGLLEAAGESVFMDEATGDEGEEAETDDDGEEV